MTRLSRFALCAAALILAGCGDDPPASADDAGTDVAADAGSDVLADTAPDAGPVVDVEPPEFDAPPVQAAAAWAPLQVEWLAGTPHPADDGARTREALERGWYAPPLPGTDADRVSWTAAAPNDEGRFEGLASQRVFLSATFASDEPTGLVVQADSAFTVWVDGRRQPGDIYGSGRMRVPFHLDAGEHWIVIEAFPPRGAPRIGLWTTPDPLAFNTSDLTLPDLVAGSTDAQYIGVPILNLSERASGTLRVRVIGDDTAWDTSATWLLPGVAAGAVTQLAVPLVPLAPIPAGVESVDVTVRVEPAALDASWEQTVTVPVVEPGTTHRRTFRSATDDSAQYYGVVPPSTPPDPSHGLVLTLHGAGVEAIGQARAYSSKDWAWIVAATNRRPFGFDWEVFGRRDAIEVLEDAQSWIAHDPTRVHVTGHSMGGHGTWQMGTLFPDRFATVGPSAGWDSFYSYGGESRPSGVFARAQASSVSSDFASNLTDRRVYVIHGDADNNVPVREARTMVALLDDIVDELTYHEEPGAGHWWDGDAAEGADCVDWPPLFEQMETARLDAVPRSFSFTTPSPWVSPRYAWATITSVATPMDNASLVATAAGDGVSLTTTNVRGLRIDAAALREGGVTSLDVDGEAVDLSADVAWVGVTDDGKREGLTGPLPQLFERPFCFVVEADDADAMAFAAWMTSSWSVLGNGSAATVTTEQLDDWARERCQPVYIGVGRDATTWDDRLPIAWDEGGVSVGDARYDGAAAAWLYPEPSPTGAERLAGAWTAPADRPDLRYRVTPFQSRFVVPDLLVWDDEGAQTGGFFDPSWALDRGFGFGMP